MRQMQFEKMKISVIPLPIRSSSPIGCFMAILNTNDYFLVITTSVAIEVAIALSAPAMEIHFMALSFFLSGLRGTMISDPGVKRGELLKMNPLLDAVVPLG